MKITTDSHCDHRLIEEHFDFILERFSDREGFFIETIEMPTDLQDAPCDLHGPIMGDAPVLDTEVVMVVRGLRQGASRLCSREPKGSRKLTIIGGPHEEDTILYTAYGGPVAPREPFDPSLDDAGRELARTFWAEHALSGPWIHGSDWPSCHEAEEVYTNHLEPPTMTTKCACGCEVTGASWKEAGENFDRHLAYVASLPEDRPRVEWMADS